MRSDLTHDMLKSVQERKNNNMIITKVSFLEGICCKRKVQSLLYEVTNSL